MAYGRPSPRTVGETVDPETGETTYFAKFGTQQLKFIDPAKPALGVTQVNVGQSFKGFTTGLVRQITGQQHPFGSPTVRNTAYPDMTITKTVGTTTPPPFPPNGNGNGEDCGWFGEKCWGNGNGNGNGEDCGWFGEKCWGNGNGNGKDCGWFGEKCWGNGNGNGKDCGWFGEKCWFDPPDLGWLKWVLIAIGIGILLWLLRPLFGIAKNITET